MRKRRVVLGGTSWLGDLVFNFRIYISPRGRHSKNNSYTGAENHGIPDEISRSFPDFRKMKIPRELHEGPLIVTNWEPAH